MADTISIEQRREFAALGNLRHTDGTKVYVTGVLNPFATVYRSDRTAHAAEFAWPTVARIVANKGRFDF